MPAAALRAVLKRFPPIRSTYYLWIALRQLASDDWRLPIAFDTIFSRQPDPWNSDHPLEHQRMAVSLAMLNRASSDGFPAALEVGCAEGIFTRRIVSLCGRLRAVDYSPVALERARAHNSAHDNVDFGHLDLRADRIDGQFDLVVVTGVLTYLVRPWDVRKAAAKLIDAVKPGGVLFFSDARQSRVFETAWWGPAMLRGGDQIRRMLASDRRLSLESAADTDAHVFALYRRVDSAPRTRQEVWHVPVEAVESLTNE